MQSWRLNGEDEFSSVDWMVMVMKAALQPLKGRHDVNSKDQGGHEDLTQGLPGRVSHRQRLKHVDIFFRECS